MLADVQAQLVEFTALIGDLVHLARDESEVVPEPLDTVIRQTFGSVNTYAGLLARRVRQGLGVDLGR